MKREVNICYDYKEGKTYWLVYGNKDDFSGPSEKSFNSKKEMNEWKKKYLIIK